MSTTHTRQHSRDERPDTTGVFGRLRVPDRVLTFEGALAAAGVPLRHVEQGRNVSMDVTDRACRAAGRLHGPMVASMRPVPARLVPVARRIGGLLPAVHGAPVHAGDPAALGIRDLDRPDFGDPVVAEPGDLPVFWACGVTPQTAVTASRPPFAITHAPGRMFVTDVRDEEYGSPSEAAVPRARVPPRETHHGTTAQHL
ncbi:hypothetical protein GCM10017562_14290 [Streptomyces roseofulvus]